MGVRDYIHASGRLAVGGGHEIYYEDWGSRAAKVPIVYLHGGPGAGHSDASYLPFNPERQRVILFDQRGAGKSTPFASLRHNTTPDLVADIDKLRDVLKIGNIQLFGGSWGSTLALCYAIANPSIVERMLLWGIFLARQQDNDFLYQGQVRQHYPDVWSRYADMIPDIAQRHTAAYYAKEFEHRDEAVRKRFIKEWVLYESSLARLDAQPATLELNLESDEKIEALAKLEAHYAVNKYFLSANYILKNARKLHSIPTMLVHGRYDFVCAPSGAFELKRAIGGAADLHLVLAGHSRSEPVMREVIQAYIRSFLQ